MQKKSIIYGLVTAGLLILGLIYYLVRPISHQPRPASFQCLDLNAGRYVSLKSMPQPHTVFAMGLSFSEHIKETASDYNPDEMPPLFKKDLRSINSESRKIVIPDRAGILKAIAEMDPGLSKQVDRDFPELPPMMDYEVELGFIVLKDIVAVDLKQSQTDLELAFIIANDVSLRTIAVLGEGQPDRYEYWGKSKSFSNFLPVSKQAWIPQAAAVNGIPCVQLQTRVNNQIVQNQSTRDMIYTPEDALRFIARKYKLEKIPAGSWVLMGTPGGVRFTTPRPIMRLSELIGMGRMRKLSIKTGQDQSKYLQAGDTVEVQAVDFLKVQTEFTR